MIQLTTGAGDSANGDFKGRKAVVTGGTSGLGLEVGRLLAQRGAQVVITGRSEERGRHAQEQLRSEGLNCSFLQCDSSDYADLVETLHRAEELMGALDTLVSAGAEGSVKPMPFAEMTVEELRESFESRFYPRILPVHAAIPLLRKQAHSSVVMIGTDAARHPTPGESMIGAVGATVVLMTKALAREFSKWSIRVNAVAMTLTSDTPSWDRIFARESFENRLFSKALERFPQGRAPTAAEVAEAVAFLACARSSQITGQTVSVNGGLSFGGW